MFSADEVNPPIVGYLYKVEENERIRLCWHCQDSEEDVEIVDSYCFCCTCKWETNNRLPLFKCYNCMKTEMSKYNNAYIIEEAYD